MIGWLKGYRKALGIEVSNAGRAISYTLTLGSIDSKLESIWILTIYLDHKSLSARRGSVIDPKVSICNTAACPWPSLQQASCSPRERFFENCSHARPARRPIELGLGAAFDAASPRM